MKKRVKKSVGVSQEDTTEIRGDEESGVVAVKEIPVKKQKKEGKKKSKRGMRREVKESKRRKSL
jgi:hypothetical protein